MSMSQAQWHKLVLAEIEFFKDIWLELLGKNYLIVLEGLFGRNSLEI